MSIPLIAGAQKLADRGLLSVRQAAHIRFLADAWEYPVWMPDGSEAHTVDGQPILRYKSYDSKAKPKCWWEPEGVAPQRPPYYLMPGAMAEAKKRGVLYFVSGEPDVWTMRAAGMPNAICAFGEMSVPSTLAADLKSFGFQGWVLIYPDMDATGWKFAARLRDYLKDSGIALMAYDLPEWLGDGGDLNRLWITTKFSADTFREALAECEPHVYRQPEKKPKLPRLTSPDKELPRTFADAIVAALENRGMRWSGHSEWSTHIPCLFVDHTHDNERPSFNYNRAKQIGHCFKCGETFLAKAVGEKLNIVLEDYLDKPRVSPLDMPTPGTDEISGTIPIPEPAPVDLWATSDTLPIRMPFPQLAELGGFAELLLPRKTTVIIGGSGATKTSFMESMIDGMRENGVNVAWWGPEWSVDEYRLRAIQRLGGPSVVQMIKHKAWLVEERRGVPLTKRVGAPLPQNLLALAGRLAEIVDNQEGRITYIEANMDSLDEVVRRTEAILAAAKEAGAPISVVVFDYLQLFSESEDEVASVNKSIGIIKAFSVRNDIHVIVTSQTTKAAQAAVKATGKLLDQGDILSGRDQKFNLTLTINPRYDGDTRQTVDVDLGDGAGLRRYYLMTVRVSKNSLGGNENVTMLFDPGRMLYPRFYEVKNLVLECD